MFFALNLKICKILRFTIQSYNLRSHLPSTILCRISILTTLVVGHCGSWVTMSVWLRFGGVCIGGDFWVSKLLCMYQRCFYQLCFLSCWVSWRQLVVGFCLGRSQRFLFFIFFIFNIILMR